MSSRGIEINNPGSTGHILEEMYAYVAVHDDGFEGILATTIGFDNFPMVAADLKAIKRFRAQANLVAVETGLTVRLVRFSNREIVQEITR